MPVLLVMAAVSLLPACGGHQDEATATRPVMSVELVAPVQQQWPDRITASGEVAPWQEAIIGAEVAGQRLDEVLVNVGDTVRKGQLLARYNDEVLRADLARLDASVAEAEANQAKAAADEVRVDKLAETNVLSAQAVMNYRTQARIAEATLASARAQRKVQALQLAHARVVAPDDGVISSRTATVGAVGTMGAELFRLVRDNRLEWRAELPADVLARLKPGLAVTVFGGNDGQIKASLRQLSPTVNEGTRNGIAYVDLPAGSGLTAGMYVKGQFTLDQRAALTVPETAVVLRDGNSYLMKVDAQHRVHELKVLTGRRGNDAIEITDGITPADRFVKSGGAFVSDGDLVQVVTSGKTAP